MEFELRSEVAAGQRPLHRDSVAAAVKQRAKAEPLAERGLVLSNVAILDVKQGAVKPGFWDISIRRGRITALSPLGAAQHDPQETVVVHCHGAFVCPGLCDAHVHCTAGTANLSALLSQPESYTTAQAAQILEGMLSRGFTTIRDAGGADFGLAKAVEEGLILGPRLLFTGHALSQTGGHGDFRQAGEDVCACGAALRGLGRVCDGDAEVRRAARDELRKGAHCIKVMASGGISSPTDRLTNTQFSIAELQAIVEEAEAAGTYVCAHAYMPTAIKRAVKAGVRSIEHGNWLDGDTAQLMAEKGAYLVPTLATYQALSDAGKEAGMPAALVAKVGDAVEQGLKSLAVAKRAGITMCYGSDLLGNLHDRQLEGLELMGRVLSPIDVIQSATCNCEELFCMHGSIGRIEPGYIADLLLIAGNPLQDLSILYEPARPAAVVDGSKAPRSSGVQPGSTARGVMCVMKEGLFMSGLVQPVHARTGQHASVNEALFAVST